MFMKKISYVAASLVLIACQQTYTMQKEESKSEIVASLPKNKSYDASRDATSLEGLFGKNLHEYTLENYGLPYTHWGETRETRPGSRPEDKARWERFGKTITSLTVAQQFLRVNEEGKYGYSEESLAPSVGLVQAENNRIYQEDLAFTQAQIDSYTRNRDEMVATYAQYCSSEADDCKKLQGKFTQAEKALQNLKKKYPLSSHTLSLPREEKKSLNPSNIRALLGSKMQHPAEQDFIAGKPQAEFPTFADALKSNRIK
jgi:hypothetical protein